jgi:site-specific DNA-methyltransferase (adenine-specific)
MSKIILGDCLEVMRGMGDNSVDLVLTDPPYGIDFQSNRRVKWQQKDKIANDKTPFVDWISDAWRVLKPSGSLLCFCRWDVQQDFINAIVGANFKLKSQIIWDKGVHGMGDLKAEFAPQHETILFAIKDSFNFPANRPTTIIKQMRVAPSELLHPNEKPEQLLAKLISYTTSEGDTVLDCFSGSGSTLYASKRLHRNYIGIEIDPKYVKIAQDRLKQEVLL